MNVNLFMGLKESKVEVLLQKVRLHRQHLWLSIWTIHTKLCVQFSLTSRPVLLQSEDDCAGYETTSYTFFIGDQEVGNMKADMLGLSVFSKRGDTAVITMTVLAYITNSSRFILTVVLSNTVEFTEIVTSSTNGVSSTLRSNTWSTKPDPFYCKLNSNSVVSCLFWSSNPLDNLKCSKSAHGLKCSYSLQYYKSCLIVCYLHIVVITWHVYTLHWQWVD